MLSLLKLCNFAPCRHFCLLFSCPAFSCPAISCLAISCPAISCRANWSVIFMSVIFSQPDCWLTFAEDDDPIQDAPDTLDCLVDHHETDIHGNTELVLWSSAFHARTLGVEYQNCLVYSFSPRLLWTSETKLISSWYQTSIWFSKYRLLILQQVHLIFFRSFFSGLWKTYLFCNRVLTENGFWRQIATQGHSRSFILQSLTGRQGVVAYRHIILLASTLKIPKT